MPVGFEIIGGPSLNQDSKVMQMIAKISHTTMNTTSGLYSSVRWTATVPHTGCIFAVSQTSGNGVHVIIGNSTTTLDGLSSTVTITASQANASFDLFVFKQGGGGAIGSGTGLEIYNADGSLGFGSNYKPLRVLSQFLYGDDVSTTEGGPYSEPAGYFSNFAGKRVACVTSTHARYFDGDGTLINGNFPYYAPRFLNSQASGNCLLDWFPIGNMGKDLQGWARNGRYMFIDVTNY